ncbi:MAG: DUF2119 domain-containing protein [Candidatus Hecatellales archaeon]|nr:MAG: DUF2119 domain-containing protein [Candidatus Hecatellales archaeon]
MVGGLHGKEGKTTEPILKKLIEGKKPAYGKLIVIPALCKNRKYVSTLNKEYYEGREGKKLLSLIQKYKPEIYVELHCYRKSAYKLLTDPKRKTKKGVPPFVEISSGVLMGSVSPHLLSMFRFRLAVVFEVPCKNLGLASKTVLKLLNDVKNGRDTEDILGCWKIKYPYQIRKAESLLYRWLGGELVD